jgi:ribonuclease Z
MKAWILGSGVPTPSLQRACSGYLLEVDGAYLVLDHGFGSFQRLLELGIPLDRITHLFFTHLHYDHMGDFARLVLTRWDQGGGLIDDLNVFGPPPLRHVAARLFDPDGAFGPDITARTNGDASLDLYRLRGGVGPRRRPNPLITEIEPGSRVRAAAWSLDTAEARHFAPYLQCHAYRITHGGRSLVYSGDSGPSEDLARLAEGCDVLIHMCHYLSGTASSEAFAMSCMGHLELAALAERARVKTLVLTHITAQLDRPGVRERVIAEIRQIYGGTVVFGADRLEIPMDGIPPAHVD